MKRSAAWFRRLEKAGRAAEDGLLVVLLSGMILLAVVQIVMRNLFDLGFQWTDELLRMLVLWVAVAGAVAASRQDRHINIMLLDRFLSERVLSGVKLLTDLFTAAVCVLVAWHSLQFVQLSREFDDMLLGEAVPAWWLQAVLPVGFALIAYRYLLFTVRNIGAAFGSLRSRP
ncbi:MAG: TRAP transporter small permease subunit [Xanthomonadales bacterium]|nr:TRAP transporter small permease subunit [Xanthomonadales bacterium]